MKIIKNYGKMFMGMGFILAAYAIGFIIWSLVSSGFQDIDPETTGKIANVFVALHFIPAIVVFVIWYISLFKRTPTQKIRSGYIFHVVIPLVAICTFLLVFIPSIISVFTSTLIYLVLNTILISLGAVLAFLFCKPY